MSFLYIYVKISYDPKIHPHVVLKKKVMTQKDHDQPEEPQSTNLQVQLSMPINPI